MAATEVVQDATIALRIRSELRPDDMAQDWQSKKWLRSTAVVHAFVLVSMYALGLSGHVSVERIGPSAIGKNEEASSIR